MGKPEAATTRVAESMHGNRFLCSRRLQGTRGTPRTAHGLSLSESLFIFPEKSLSFIPMNLRNVLIGFLGALLLTVSGIHAADPQVVTHVAAAAKTEVTVRYAEDIRILLPFAPDATSQRGFEWQIISNDSRILRLTSSPKPAPNTEKSTAPNAAATWSATFLALRPGRSIVRFAYVRASESGVETPADSREIIVTVNG